MTTFERVKEISEKHGFSSLRTLAETAGLGTNAIYNWKKSEPTTKSAKAVADVLGVSVDYLLGNTDDQTNITATNESDDLKDFFEKHPVLSFDGKEIPETELKIIKRILEDME